MSLADTYRQYLSNPQISDWKRLRSVSSIQIDEFADKHDTAPTRHTALSFILQILKLRADLYVKYASCVPTPVHQAEDVFLDAMVEGQLTPEDWPEFVGHDDWLWAHVPRTLTAWYLQQTGATGSTSRISSRIKKIASFLDNDTLVLKDVYLLCTTKGSAWSLPRAAKIGKTGSVVWWIAKK